MLRPKPCLMVIAAVCLLSLSTASAAPTVWGEVSFAMDIGDYARAERELLASPLTETRAAHQAALGLILTKRRQYEQAEAAFRKAIELEPLNSSHQWNLGEFLYLTGQFAKAAEAYANVVEPSPQHHLAIYKHVLSLLQSGRSADAQTLVSRLRFHEDHPLFLYAHAALRFEAGRIEEGRWFAESARALYEAAGVRIYRQPLIDLGWINPD